MLWLEDIYNSIRVLSGQYLIPQDKIELKPNLFVSVVEQALAIYNRYCPHDTHFRLDLMGARSFTFVEQSPYGVPEKIVDAIPFGTPINFNSISLGMFQAMPPNPSLTKSQVPFLYRKPTLYVAFSAEYDIHAVYYHKIEKEIVDGKEKLVIKTLDTYDSSEFVQLCLAKFLMALGRSRRAFSLNDLPISNDSSDLVSEGQMLEERIIQDLVDNKHKFYLCWS